MLVKNDNDTDSAVEYAAKLTNYAKDIIREFCLNIFWGSKLTAPVHKAFEIEKGASRTHPASCKQLTDALIQPPLHVNCLVIENSKEESNQSTSSYGDPSVM